MVERHLCAPAVKGTAINHVSRFVHKGAVGAAHSGVPMHASIDAARLLANENTQLQNKLAAARDNVRFADKRIAALEVECAAAALS